MAPIPLSSAWASEPAFSQVTDRSFSRFSNAVVASASRLVAGRRSTRYSSECSASTVMRALRSHTAAFTGRNLDRHAGQHPPQLHERVAQVNSARVELEAANRPFAR